MYEDRYFKVRITTPKLAAQGKVLVYATVIDCEQQFDCERVSREHGYQETDIMMVSAIANVTSNLPRGEGDDELIPVSVSEVSPDMLGAMALTLMKRRN